MGIAKSADEIIKVNLAARCPLLYLRLCGGLIIQ
jgi:hypothetical protein